MLGASLADTEATAGRSALLGAMLDKGTAEHSARQIAEYFDSIGGQLSMSAGRNTIFGSATVLPGDVVLGTAQSAVIEPVDPLTLPMEF